MPIVKYHIDRRAMEKAIKQQRELSTITLIGFIKQCFKSYFRSAFMAYVGNSRGEIYLRRYTYQCFFLFCSFYPELVKKT